jgi:hypothetical protein
VGFGFLLLVAVACHAQRETNRGPNGEVLPFGYKHRVESGIDSYVGVIYKRGIRIEYDIGEMAGRETGPDLKERALKFVERVQVEGQILDFGMAPREKNQVHMVITIPGVPANFFITCKKADQETQKKELFLIASNYAKSLGKPNAFK